MKKAKIILSLLLLTFIVLSLFSGCDGKGDSSSKPQDDTISDPSEISIHEYYSFTNKETGLNLEAVPIEGNAINFMSMKPAAEGDNQAFQIYKYREGYFIVSKANGKALLPGSNSTVTGRGVQIANIDLSSSFQQWKIEKAEEEGYFKIINCGSSLALTDDEGPRQTTPLVWDAQLWKISKAQSPKWELVWSDEFEGPEINKDNWIYEEGYQRNNELQSYTKDPKNAFIRDGCLVIKTIKEPTPSRYANPEGKKVFEYSSASLLTLGKQEWLYGRFEMKARLPKGQAIWPAFWMCGTQDEWPENGEIDILEMWGGEGTDGRISCNLHWSENGQYTKWSEVREIILPNNEKFNDSFHIFALEWDENQLRFYMDDLLYAAKYINTPGMEKGYRQPHHLWVNTAVAPDEWGWGDASINNYPQEYIIDYIRVYQQQPKTETSSIESK